LNGREGCAGTNEEVARLDEYLRVVVPHLSRDLISDAGRENLHALGQVLPVTDLAGFEFDLDTDAGRVDMITRHPKGRSEIPPRLSSHPVWKSVSRCLRQLDNPAGSLAESVKVIDLEFDLPGPPAGIPVPGIFLELKRNIEMPVETVAMLAAQILDASLPDWMNTSLGRCLDLLPPGARVIHLGAMRSRDVQQLRLVIGRLSPSLMPQYLDSLGWGGDCRQFDEAIGAFSPLVDSMTLSLDLGRHIGDRVGIECFLGTAGDAVEQWRVLLQQLQRQNLCREAKVRALLAWRGICQEASCNEPWPRSLAWGDALLGDAVASVFVRFLSHVKLVSRPRAPLSVKGYVGFAHYWSRRGEQVVDAIPEGLS
jgi:hypothetical protein